jgi:hypothetical protein
MRSCLLYTASAIGLAVATFGVAETAEAQRVIEIEYTPTRRAQIAVWLASPDGTYLRTLSLTQSVALYGIGNRPGALQMNSGFRWPYGRREGALPAWAHARLEAPGAQPFRRVIYQDRLSEGHASRSASDFSPDDHFCLSFNNATTQRDALDAVTCASLFNSDKGRYLTEADVSAGYREPAESAPGTSGSYALGLDSLYPPRRDVRRCDEAGCYDHPDVDLYNADARRVMPEIDAVTTATPPGEVAQRLMFTVPDDWTNGTYYVYVEVNVEGDYAPEWGPTQHPTPRSDTGVLSEQWDYWAMNYGYPYRGQPSIVYRVPVTIGDTTVAGTTEAMGYGSLEGRGPNAGEITPMDDSITNDPTGAAGSGVDRLRIGDGGYRVRVRSQAAEACRLNRPPMDIQGLEVSQYHERRDAHRFAHLSFVAPSDDEGVVHYEVRVSDSAITDETTFLMARPANAASLDNVALEVPTDVPAGEAIEVDLGGLAFERHYWIGVRATDACNAASTVTVTEYDRLAVLRRDGGLRHADGRRDRCPASLPRPTPADEPDRRSPRGRLLRGGPGPRGRDRRGRRAPLDRPHAARARRRARALDRLSWPEGPCGPSPAKRSPLPLHAPKRVPPRGAPAPLGASRSARRDLESFSVPERGRKHPPAVAGDASRRGLRSPLPRRRREKS